MLFRRLTCSALRRLFLQTQSVLQYHRWIVFTATLLHIRQPRAPFSCIRGEKEVMLPNPDIRISSHDSLVISQLRLRKKFLGLSHSDIKIHSDSLNSTIATSGLSHLPSPSRYNVEPSPVFSPRPARSVALAQKVEPTLRRGQARIRQVDTRLRSTGFQIPKVVRSMQFL